MAGITPASVAFQVVKQGLSARQGLILARSQGIQIRDATWFRLVGEVRTTIGLQSVEAGLPLNRKPVGAEIGSFPTKNARGWLQYADVFVRDKDTGIVTRRPYAVRGTNLQTRQAVIKKAINAMTQAATPFGSFPNDQVLGGIYTTTYQMAPGTV